MYSCFPLEVVYTLFYIKQSNNYLYEKKKKERKNKNHFVVIKMPSGVLYKWCVHLIFTHLYMKIKFCDISRPSNELYLKKFKKNLIFRGLFPYSLAFQMFFFLKCLNVSIISINLSINLHNKQATNKYMIR